MKVGLSICAALLLNPYEMIPVNVEQKTELKPQVVIDKSIKLPKRVGRKQIRKSVLTVYLNYENYSIMIPYDVLSKIGDGHTVPNYIQMSWDYDKRRIIIRPATKTIEEALVVPEKKHENSLLSLPTILSDNPISAMGWNDTPHEVEALLVRDSNKNTALLLDLKAAKEVQYVNGCFVVPECLTENDNDFEETDEDKHPAAPFPHTVYFDDDGNEIGRC